MREDHQYKVRAEIGARGRPRRTPMTSLFAAYPRLSVQQEISPG
jgi:hypothetical protein